MPGGGILMAFLEIVCHFNGSFAENRVILMAGAGILMASRGILMSRFWKLWHFNGRGLRVR